MPWIVLDTVPSGAGSRGRQADAPTVAGWASRHVADWPATFAIGTEHVDWSAGSLLLTPSRAGARPAATYCCKLRDDGSSMLAIQLGARRAGADGIPVWVVGEGAIAWLTIALLRFGAAYAERVGVTGDATVGLSLRPAVDLQQAAPFEVWNHDAGTYAPAGDRRLQEVAPSCGTVALRACLCADVASVARSFVVQLFGQFGLAESRHIDPSGTLRPQHFTGHEALIRGWAERIGLRVEP